MNAQSINLQKMNDIVRAAGFTPSRWLRVTGRADVLIPKQEPAIGRQSAQFRSDSEWVLERFHSEGDNLIGTDAYNVTGFTKAWDAFHREVASETEACTWALVNTETGQKFAEVSL